MKPKPTKLRLLAGNRRQGESDKAVQACNDWLRLGSGRTLSGLAKKYTKVHQDTPPTTSADTLKRWSTTFDWAGRATTYDAAWEERKNAKRLATFNKELALDFGRVRKLMALADFLEGQIYELDAQGNFINLWVQDAKGIGSRENFERVDIERFNAPLIEQFRRTLDDIAKEVGGRIQKKDITSGGQPLVIWSEPVIGSDDIGIGADELPESDDTP